MTIPIKTGLKLVHLLAKSTMKVELTKEQWAELPKPVGLLASIQHNHTLRKLHDDHKEDSILGGQVLGCRCEAAERIDSTVKSYLVIATGYFHSQRVALNTGKPVFVYDPVQKTLTKQPREQLDNILKARKTALLNFYNANTVGILVSVKHGQCDIAKVETFITELDSTKKTYLFAFDTLELPRLEDYNFIDIWVNTACNRIPDEKKNMIDIGDIPEYAKYSESWLKNPEKKKKLRS